MAALEARSLLTRETIRSPNALYPNRVSGIVRTVGGFRLEQWAIWNRYGWAECIGIRK